MHTLCNTYPIKRWHHSYEEGLHYHREVLLCVVGTRVNQVFNGLL